MIFDCDRVYNSILQSWGNQSLQEEAEGLQPPKGNEKKELKRIR